MESCWSHDQNKRDVLSGHLPVSLTMNNSSSNSSNMAATTSPSWISWSDLGLSVGSSEPQPLFVLAQQQKPDFRGNSGFNIKETASSSALCSPAAETVSGLMDTETGTSDTFVPLPLSAAVDWPGSFIDSGLNIAKEPQSADNLSDLSPSISHLDNKDNAACSNSSSSSDNNVCLTDDGSVSDVSSLDSAADSDSWTDFSEVQDAEGTSNPTRYWAFKELWDALPNVDPNGMWTETQVMTEATQYIKHLQNEVCQTLGVKGLPHEVCPALFVQQVTGYSAETTTKPSGASVQDSVYKRPKNGFIRYAMKNRKAVAQEYPKLDNREISRMLGVKWKKLSQEEKKQYEEEFHAEMAERRKVFPDWKYGMTKKSMLPDQDDPIPSRLRPRDKLKRKFFPGQLKRFYKRRKVQPTRRRSVWVQCDRCSKWRQMPEGTEAHALPDKWYCEYNVGPYNSCQVAEETNIPSTEDSSSSSVECPMTQMLPATGGNSQE